jgi:dUTP pyrophosphatase
MFYPNTLQIECQDKNLMPVRAHIGDGGLDLRSSREVLLMPLESVLISTGIKVAIPLGFVGLLFSRSGMAKHNITLVNSVGVIDHSYRGEIKVYLVNNGTNPFQIIYADRIAQLVLVPCSLPELELVEVVPSTIRGEDGFGSTGTA